MQQTTVQPMVDNKYGGAAEIMALPAAKLVAILKDPAASEYAKAKACQQLAVVGDKSAVPALAALLGDEKLSHYARFGLEPNPDASAGDALREAMGKLTGKLRVGVINSLGVRRDTKSIEALALLMRGADVDAAKAAAAALARIRPMR
jgi:HEAT repeat protein